MSEKEILERLYEGAFTSGKWMTLGGTVTTRKIRTGAYSIYFNGRYIGTVDKVKRGWRAESGADDELGLHKKRDDAIFAVADYYTTE